LMVTSLLSLKMASPLNSLAVSAHHCSCSGRLLLRRVASDLRSTSSMKRPSSVTPAVVPTQPIDPGRALGSISRAPPRSSPRRRPVPEPPERTPRRRSLYLPAAQPEPRSSASCSCLGDNCRYFVLYGPVGSRQVRWEGIPLSAVWFGPVGSGGMTARMTTRASDEAWVRCGGARSPSSSS
jgi:hypothetical protein